MLKSYLTIALRNLRRNGGYTAINLIGLAVGLAACLLIGLYVHHELSYDDFHENSERIYRVVEHPESGTSHLMHTARLAPALQSRFANVEQTVRVSGRWGRNRKVQGGNHTFYEDNVLFADSSFFEVFDFPLHRGAPETVLAEPYSALLTETTAEKYFGAENPIGKTIQVSGYGQQHELTVTGVVEDPPSNSHIDFNVLLSFGTLTQATPRLRDLTSWDYRGHYTYARLAEGAVPSTLASRLSTFVENQRSKSNAPSTFDFQPIGDIHLYSDFAHELKANGDVRSVYLFVTLAVLILGLACVNYVNLATAQARRRVREVGVRKTVGAHRRQLIGQYLGESALLCAAALVAAVGLAWATLPYVNDLVGVSLGAHLFAPVTLLLVGALGAVVAVGAGAYPAFYLSSFRPGEMLGTSTTTGAGQGRLRKGLIVAQFSIAVALIAGTVLIHQQLRHMQSKELGLEAKQVVIIHAKEALWGSYSAFKQELLQRADVSGVTASNRSLPTTEKLTQPLVPEGADQGEWESDPKVPINVMGVAPDFQAVLQIPLVSGRGFSASTGSDDETPVLINETAAERLGWEEPVGKTFPCCQPSTLRVIGVVGDFHYKPLRQGIQPLVLMASSNPQHVLVRTQGEDGAGTLNGLRDAWSQVSDAPFEYSFLAQRYDSAYRPEQRMATTFTAFAGLAILIACLGLFGLIAYAVTRRKQEIGLRKVLGATATDVVALLSKEVLLLVGFACAIAVPVAYVGGEQWLQDFAYRVDVRPWVFVGASGLAAVIALATISVHAVRAAQTDPATTLRDE